MHKYYIVLGNIRIGRGKNPGDGECRECFSTGIEPHPERRSLAWPLHRSLGMGIAMLEEEVQR